MTYKILFLGNIDSTSTSRYYYTNLIAMGHSVFAWNPNFFNSGLLNKIHTKFFKEPTPHVIYKFEKNLHTFLKENTFDLIFVFSENFLSLECLKKIKSRLNPPILIYHSHDNNFSKDILKPKYFFEALSLYDFVFTTKSQNVSRYKDLGQKNSFFLASAFEPSIHHPIVEEQSQYKRSTFNISFIGTYDKSREKFMEVLGWDRVHIWGDRWPQKSALIHPKAIYCSEFSDVLSHSFCSLGLLREEAEDLHTQRTFEIPACGSLQISPRNDEILSFFKEDEEIVCFSSLEELKEKVDYLLTHPQVRNKIAKQGYQKVISGNHTYLDRVKWILEKVQNHKLSERSIK